MKQTPYLFALNFILMTCLLPNISYATINKLELHKVANAKQQQAVCLDGSPAVFYLSRNTQQKNWLIMLGGGTPCGTLAQCKKSLKTKPRVTSSTHRKKYMLGKGLLSENKQINPAFANWNKVFVPQCSMDVWIGNQPATKNTHGLAFQGGSIVRAVFTTLKSLGLTDADQVLFVGTSAGGIGMMNHIDWVTRLLPNSHVKGLVDGGWVLDSPAFSSSSTINQDIMHQLSSLTPVLVNEECRKEYANEAWQCIFGSRVYPHIQSPLLVHTAQNDRIHLSRLGILFDSSNTKETAYIDQHKQQVCNSLSNVANYFSLTNTPHTVVKNKNLFLLSHDGQAFYNMIADFMNNHLTEPRVTTCKGS